MAMLKRFLKEKDFEDNKWEGTEKSYYNFFPKNIQSYYGKPLIIKIAMINVHKQLLQHNLKSKLLLQVHDELVFDMHKEEEVKLKLLVEKEMMNAVKFDVPLEVEIGVGENWLIAH